MPEELCLAGHTIEHGSVSVAGQVPLLTPHNTIQDRDACAIAGM